MLTAYLQCLSIFQMGGEMYLLIAQHTRKACSLLKHVTVNGIQLNSRHQMQRVVIQQPETVEGAEEGLRL